MRSGAGAATDAFFVAFKIPNFLRRLFAEGPSRPRSVPVLMRVQGEAQRRGAATVRRPRRRYPRSRPCSASRSSECSAGARPGRRVRPGFLREPAVFDLRHPACCGSPFPYLLADLVDGLRRRILNTTSASACRPSRRPPEPVADRLRWWLAPALEQPITALPGACCSRASGDSRSRSRSSATLNLLPALQAGGRATRGFGASSGSWCGAVRRVGGADQPAVRHPDRVLPRRGQHHWLYYSDR